MADRRQYGGGHDHLGETKPKRQPSHAHKALPRQFQADHEQQEDEAKFGDPRDAINIGNGQRG
jgi:hypothetical protein